MSARARERRASSDERVGDARRHRLQEERRR
jgi:hypothetical protein